MSNQGRAGSAAPEITPSQAPEIQRRHRSPWLPDTMDIYEYGLIEREEDEPLEIKIGARYLLACGIAVRIVAFDPQKEVWIGDMETYLFPQGSWRPDGESTCHLWEFDIVREML